MSPRDYFPLGKALGKAFCNRKHEIKWLVDNIQANKHSLLMAPRRYGKSSLAEAAIKKSKLPATSISFNTCTEENDVAVLITQGVCNLIGKAIGPIEKIMNSLKNYVTNLTPKINLGGKLAKLELTTNKIKNPALTVKEALMLLEKLLTEKNQRAIMLFDEFQIVGVIAQGSGVEAAIRNAVQDLQHLVIIFSGSNRHLLQTMFEDESRPLYKLCRKLYLDRIEPIHYQKHFNKAANLAWDQDLSEDVFKQIIYLSEQHPYYVNYLCDVLWTNYSSIPNVNKVNDAWRRVIIEEKSDANIEISQLSLGQKKIIKYIANYSGKQLMSTKYVKVSGMALSSISAAISALVKKDIIEKRDDSYYIINPIIKYILNASSLINKI